MMNATRLRNEHEQMRRLLGLLRHEAAALEHGDEADLELMCDVLGYITEYPDPYHHPIEDLALWRLVQRGIFAPAVADELDFEHRTVRHHGGQLRQLLDGARADVLAPRAWIAMAAEQYAGALHAHMMHEEHVLLPLVEQHLAPRDWEEIAKGLAPAADPLLGDNVDSRFQRLRASIAERAHCGCETEGATSRTAEALAAS